MTKPCIWLNEAEGNGLADCGCSLNRDYKFSDNPAFFFCPLHKAAGELLEAAKQAAHSIRRGQPGISLKGLDDAIAKAKEGSK